MPSSLGRIAPALLAAAGALFAACGRPGPEPGSLRGWNVLLITIDTLRADRVGFAGHEGAETPNLDRLAESGTVFLDAVAAAPVTLPSHATILTGRTPPAHGALDNGFYSLPDGVPTLATALQGAGYETAAFVGAFVLHRRYGLAAGFETYDDHFRDPLLPGAEHVERRAEEVVARARAWLAGRSPERPFFLWVHCFDPHSPYDPPEPFGSRFHDRAYDGEIAYTDRELGALVEAARSAGLLERTLVVMTADHGEALGDGGERTHGLLLRGSTLRVPLVLSAPGVLPEGRRIEGTVSTADLAPTVLELVGVAPPAAMDGSSLLGAVEEGRAAGRRAYSETRLPLDQLGWSMLAGVRDDRWAYVRAPRPELYDLAADRGESRNVAAENPETAGALDAEVGAELARLGGTDRRELTPEEEEALRALGYVSGEPAPDAGGADPKDMLPVWNRLQDLQSAFAAGRPDVVLGGVDKLLDRDPGNREARMLRAQALLQAGRTGESLRELRAIVADGGDPDRAGTLIAQALIREGRTVEAEATYRALMAAAPEFAEHPFNLGVLLWGEGRRAEAAAAYEHALALNPDAVHVIVNLAQSLGLPDFEGADPARALQLIDRAVLLASDDRPRLFKVYLCAQLGRRDEAKAVARELAARRQLRGVTPQELAEAIRFAEGR
jgi:arylsulfatase A-like enzyme/Flp pilus assembly protein TadD